jgi:hypothetical protein
VYFVYLALTLKPTKMRALILTLFLSFSLLSLQAQSLNIVATNDTAICFGDTVQLEVMPTAGTAPFTYLWLPSSNLECDTCAVALAYPNDTTEYMVTVTDSNSISDTAYVAVNVFSGGYVTGDSLIDISAYFSYPSSADFLNFSVDSSLFQGGNWVVILDFDTGTDTISYFGNSFNYNNLWDKCVLPVKTELNCFASVYACFTPTNSCFTYCTDTVIGIADVGGSIAEKNTIQVQASPNPTSNSIQLISSIYSPATIEVFNSLGELVFQHQAIDLIEEQVDVSNLSSGIYILHIQTKDGLAVHRVVKN